MRTPAVVKTARRARNAYRIGKKVAAVGFATAAGGAALTGALLLRSYLRQADWSGKVVCITGGSRGLGFAMAQEAARLGAKLAICARDDRDLNWAQQELTRAGADVLATVCDVGNNEDVEDWIKAVQARFGRIDVLINNAGVISVGPLASQTLTDYEEAIDIMYWGVVYPTLAVLPQMIQRGGGAIANITSIGGKIAVPHLLPYSAAKFAAVGFSEGLRAEVAKYGIGVTTVCPGLMRTGSHLNAYFKGDHRKEFTWFSLGATLPGVSIEASRAARKIVGAIRRNRAELVITPQAKLAVAFHGLLPGLTTNILALVDRFMPEATGGNQTRYRGKESETPVTQSVLTHFGRKAARKYNQNREASDAGLSAPEPASA